MSSNTLLGSSGFQSPVLWLSRLQATHQVDSWEWGFQDFQGPQLGGSLPLTENFKTFGFHSKLE